MNSPELCLDLAVPAEIGRNPRPQADSNSAGTLLKVNNLPANRAVQITLLPDQFGPALGADDVHARQQATGMLRRTRVQRPDAPAGLDLILAYDADDLGRRGVGLARLPDPAADGADVRRLPGAIYRHEGGVADLGAFVFFFFSAGFSSPARLRSATSIRRAIVALVWGDWPGRQLWLISLDMMDVELFVLEKVE